MRQPSPKQKSNSTSNLMRYTGMGMQLIVMLGLAVWAGLALDRYTEWSVPVFLIVLPLAALFIFLYKLIKDLSSKK